MCFFNFPSLPPPCDRLKIFLDRRLPESKGYKSLEGHCGQARLFDPGHTKEGSPKEGTPSILDQGHRQHLVYSSRATRVVLNWYHSHAAAAALHVFSTLATRRKGHTKQGTPRILDQGRRQHLVYSSRTTHVVLKWYQSHAAAAAQHYPTLAIRRKGQRKEGTAGNASYTRPGLHVSS